MTRSVSLSLAVSALTLLLAASASSAAGAGTISRDTLQRRLLDACVYRQFQVKDMERMSMIENCRCATKAAMTGMEGDSFDEPRSGGLTGPQDQAIRAGIQSCFKTKK
jgi:hypothetical protein